MKRNENAPIVSGREISGGDGGALVSIPSKYPSPSQGKASPDGAIPLAVAGDPFSPNHICDPRGDRCRQSSIPELIGGLLDSYSHTHYSGNEWAFMSELTGKKVEATSGWVLSSSRYAGDPIATELGFDPYGLR